MNICQNCNRKILKCEDNVTLYKNFISGENRILSNFVRNYKTANIKAMGTIKAKNQKNLVTNLLNSTKSSEAESYDMVVFCHLRWEFVYQRPQHIISRIAKDIKVLFIEEPIGPDSSGESGNLMKITENLHILQPKVGSIHEIADILPEYVSGKSVDIGWFYSASFVPLLDAFDFEAIVYDCMDELTLFKGAPAELLVQEKFLIANAHIVFTGGKSLYESKKEMHNNVYCFPSSVDQEHFAKAQNGISVPSDIAEIAQPIVGYYGVIDERIDLQLLNETAVMNPDISFVMIGPLAKINEGDLPRPGNIHYLGMRSYDVLPNYLKAFTIAMMPFALNDATKFISPTKTLEYMSAGKPIISTAIKDVVRDYDHCISIIDSPEKFTQAIKGILQKPFDMEMESHYGQILEKTSWNNTVDKMNLLINKTVRS